MPLSVSDCTSNFVKRPSEKRSNMIASLIASLIRCARQAAQIETMRANYEASAREHLATKRALEAQLKEAHEKAGALSQQLNDRSSCVNAIDER